MLRSTIATVVLGVAVGVAGSTPASAQTFKVEASVFAGWVFSDGVSGQNVAAGNGNFYNRLDPKDSGSFGFTIAGHATHDVEYGFMYGQQFTRLLASGTDDLDLGRMNTMNYHGYVGVNLGHADAKMRPFAFVGLGATHFGTVNTPGDRIIGGETQFSTKWGGGVKYYPTPKVGLRVAFQWTPTYIKSDSEGWWCSYWGCYVVASSQYSNQFEFSGGVTFRFGGGD